MAKPKRRYDKEYQSDYYQRNKARILERRRKRYAEDNEYREKAKVRAREWQRRMHVPSDPTAIISEDGGTYFTISHVAEAIQRDITTIRQYHSEGVIPMPTKFTNRGWRLYTAKQIQLLQVVFERFTGKEDIRKALSKRWRQCG